MSNSYTKKTQSSTRHFRLYIGNSNWVTLSRKTSEDLNAIFQKGEATRYEISPGLYFDILPNDVDCNSKNTDLCRLMRVDLSYDTTGHKNDEDQEAIQQQRLSEFIKRLLESQGTMDAFPPTKKANDTLPRVLDLPSHRHLSLVPTPPLGTHGRRSVGTNANSSIMHPPSSALAPPPLIPSPPSGSQRQSSGNNNRRKGLSLGTNKRQRGAARRKTEKEANVDGIDVGDTRQDNDKMMIMHELMHPMPGGSGSSFSPDTVHDTYPFYAMGMSNSQQQSSSVILSPYEREALPPLPSLHHHHQRENPYHTWPPSAHHYHTHQRQSPITFHSSDHYHSILDAHNTPWMSPHCEHEAVPATDSIAGNQHYFHKTPSDTPTYMLAAATFPSLSAGPLSEATRYPHPQVSQSPTVSHETIVSQEGFPFLQPNVSMQTADYIVPQQPQQTVSEDGHHSI